LPTTSGGDPVIDPEGKKEINDEYHFHEILKDAPPVRTKESTGKKGKEENSTNGGAEMPSNSFATPQGRTLSPGTAAESGYQNIGQPRNPYYTDRPTPGSGGLGAPRHQDLSREEIVALRRQLPTLMANRRVDKSAMKQLHVLARNTQGQPAFSHRNLEAQEEIRRQSRPQTTRSQAASTAAERTVTRTQAQEKLPHLDLRGVYARMMNPSHLFFKIDYFNDAPFLSDIQLYQFPRQIQNVKQMFNWLGWHFRAHLVRYLRETICMTFRLSPVYLVKRYTHVLQPALITAAAEMTNEQQRRGHAPHDKYLQALEKVAQKTPLPIMNTPVIDIVDAGILPLELLRLFVERRATMENEVTEWERHLRDHDPYLLQYGGPVVDQDDIEDEMAQMYQRYTRYHMAEHDSAFRLAQNRGSTQRYVSQNSSDGRISWSGRLPRKGLSQTHPGYANDFGPRDADAESLQDLNDIYSVMRNT
jgi:hypothetical protein